MAFIIHAPEFVVAFSVAAGRFLVRDPSSVLTSVDASTVAVERPVREIISPGSVLLRRTDVAREIVPVAAPLDQLAASVLAARDVISATFAHVGTTHVPVVVAMNPFWTAPF